MYLKLPDFRAMKHQRDPKNGADPKVRPRIPILTATLYLVAFLAASRLSL
jgi:hypothetical protein